MSVNNTVLKNARNGRYGATQIDDEEVKEVTGVLKTKELFRYDRKISKTNDLEEKLQKHFGISNVLALCNGSASLKAAMVAAQIKKGDEVLVTPYTFIATVNSIISLGAVPVFVDIDETLSLDLTDAEKKISSKTIAMITVHIQGDGTNIKNEAEFCRKHKLVFIEDCAQSFGTKVNGQFVGTAGSLGCFSLQANKLITCGEGGFLITDDAEFYQRARNFHDQGGNREVDSFANWDNPMALFGENLKISEVQSAVALAQFNKVEIFLSKLRSNRAKIENGIKENEAFRLRKCVDPGGCNGVAVPFIAESKNHRNAIIDKLLEKSVPVTSLYDKLIYEFDLYRNDNEHWKVETADCKNAEDLKCRMFWVLNSLEYTENEVNYIIEVLNKLI